MVLHVSIRASIVDNGRAMVFKHFKPRYAVRDLTVLLGACRTTIYAEMRRGNLRSYKYKGRRYSDPTDLDDYVALCREESEK